MKISDDYRAKIRLWAMRPTVVALPTGPCLPHFAAKKFQTHLELNQWKKSQLRKLLAAKRAANRPQDQADIEFLTELQRLGKL